MVVWYALPSPLMYMSVKPLTENFRKASRPSVQHPEPPHCMHVPLSQVCASLPEVTLLPMTVRDRFVMSPRSQAVNGSFE